jgi:hypothetical protein
VFFQILVIGILVAYWILGVDIYFTLSICRKVEKFSDTWCFSLKLGYVLIGRCLFVLFDSP